MRADLLLSNDSAAFSVVAVSALGRVLADGRSNDGALVLAHDAFLVELEGDEYGVVRVVANEALRHSEEAEWVSRVRGRLEVGEGGVLVAGGFDPDDLSRFADGRVQDESDCGFVPVRRVPVPPGDYAVTFLSYLDGLSGQVWMGRGAFPPDWRMPRDTGLRRVTSIVQLRPWGPGLVLDPPCEGFRSARRGLRVPSREPKGIEPEGLGLRELATGIVLEREVRLQADLGAIHVEAAGVCELAGARGARLAVEVDGVPGGPRPALYLGELSPWDRTFPLHYPDRLEALAEAAPGLLVAYLRSGEGTLVLDSVERERRLPLLVGPRCVRLARGGEPFHGAPDPPPLAARLPGAAAPREPEVLDVAVLCAGSSLAVLSLTAADLTGLGPHAVSEVAMHTGDASVRVALFDSERAQSMETARRADRARHRDAAAFAAASRALKLVDLKLARRLLTEPLDEDDRARLDSEIAGLRAERERLAASDALYEGPPLGAFFEPHEDDRSRVVLYVKPLVDGAPFPFAPGQIVRLERPL